MTATQPYPLMTRLGLAALASLGAACAPVQPTPPSAARTAPALATREAAPTATACPKELAAVARCLAGQDSAGAPWARQTAVNAVIPLI